MVTFLAEAAEPARRRTGMACSDSAASRESLRWLPRDYISFSRADYNMGFSNFRWLAPMNVTGEDRRGHERTGEDRRGHFFAKIGLDAFSDFQGSQEEMKQGTKRTG